MKLKAVLIISLLIAQKGFNQSVVTIPALLGEMTDYTTVAKYPDPFFNTQQASSYDRRSVSPSQPGWFGNADQNQFIREEKKADRSEFVMMDAEGPGVVVRFWLTTMAKAGTMRFYFDNEEQASIVIPAFDLMKAGFNLGPALLNPHSSYEPTGKGGNTLYFPLPYQRHCKITWQFADSTNMKTPHYYQVNYRTYAAGTKVQTFLRSHLDKYRKDIDRAEAMLWDPPVSRGKMTGKEIVLKAGQETAITLPAGSHAIRELMIQLYNAREVDWRSTLIKIQFDGYETVLCPLGDFVGSGYGGKVIRSWYRQMTDSGKITSRWVMPYKRSAVISFTNRSSQDIRLQAKVMVSPIKWDDRTMHFHATYKYEEHIRDAKWDYDVTKVAQQDTAGPIDWNFITIKTKGVYMGNTLAVNNHMKSWYGEGDAKAYVDGERFPSEFGTGLEDYYNTSWAPVVLYQTPFANAPRADWPSSTGHNTFTRTRNLDRIPFKFSFVFDMEMLSWDGGEIDAAATTYWYGFEEKLFPL